MKKRIIKFLGMVSLVSIMAVILVGCSGKETTSTYRKEQNGVTLELTYKAKGDKVYEQTAKNIMPYSAVGATTAEEAKAILEPLSEKYQGIDGLKESIEYGESEAIETLSINYDKVDIDDISSLEGVTIDSSAKKNGVSLKKSEELLENQGFEKVK